MFGFSSAGNKGWSDISVSGTIIIGIVVIALFVWRQLEMETPMLEMRVFKSKTFTMTTIIGSILSIVSIGAGIMVPIFLQSILGKSAFTSGLVLLPGALIMAVMMLISGRLFDKHGVKKLAIPGIILLVIGTVPFVNLNRNTSIMSITVLYALRYIGIALITRYFHIFRSINFYSVKIGSKFRPTNIFIFKVINVVSRDIYAIKSIISNFCSASTITSGLIFLYNLLKNCLLLLIKNTSNL